MKNIFQISFLALIAMLCLCKTAFAAETEKAITPLPEIGKVISGFKAVSTDSIPELNATTMLFEHEESGAQVLYIQNEDNNLALATTFRTYAYTDKGMAHVLEHSLLSGSENYPGNSVFFDLMSRGYFSFINAYTYQNYTCYPFTTTSEKEFMNTADIYLDMLFHPSLQKEPRIFKREGIRFELNNKEDALAPIGVVYNEMQQSDSDIESMGYDNVKRSLYPDTPDQYKSGGKPLDILNLTYDEEMEFYHKYYDPSRARIIIYGNMDYRAFLEMINRRFFAGVKKLDSLEVPAEQKPFDQVKFETFKQPVSQDSGTEKQSMIFYSMGISRKISDDEKIGLKILANDVFNNNAFPLKKKLMDTGLASDYSFFYTEELLQPTIMMEASYSDADGAKKFYQTVQDVLKEETDKGLNKDLLSAVIENELMKAKMIGESDTKGLDSVLNAVGNWQLLDDPLFQAKLPSHLKEMKAKIDQGFFEDLIRKNILNNTLAAVVTTVPEPGLLEKNAADQKKLLADKKAAMSDAEIQNLIKGTKDYTDWTQKTDTPQSTLDKLSVMTVADLPENVDKFDISDETADGIRTVSTVSALPDVSLAGMNFDISALDVETMCYLDFYTALCGKLPTEKYSAEDLSLQITRLLYSHSERVSPSTVKYRSTEYIPKLSVSWIYLNQNSAEVMDLMHEILYRTKLDKSSLPELKNVIQQELSGVQSNMNDFYYYYRNRAKAQVDPQQKFINTFTFGNYKTFLKQLSKDVESDPDAVFAKLEAARKASLNKNGLILSYAGPDGSKAAFDQDIQTMTVDASAVVLPKQKNDFAPAPADEGIIADTSVNYNSIQAYDEKVIPYTKALSVISSVVDDKLIYPKIREEGGAYGGHLGFYLGCFEILSYQDPHVKESLAIFRSVPDFLKKLEISQDELNHYIITSYADLENNCGSLTKAENAINDYLIGKTTEDRLNEFKEEKSVKPEDLALVGSKLEELMKYSSLLVIGGPDVINQNKDLFKTITDIR